MSDWPQRLEIARWEVSRFVKPKQLIVSVLIIAGMYGVGYALASFAQRSDRRVVTVAVVGGAALGLKSDTVSQLALVPADTRSPDSLHADLAKRKIDGILTLHGTDSAELAVRRAPVWQSTIEARLTGARQQRRLAESRLSAEQLASILRPVRITVQYQAGGGGSGALFAAIIAAVLIAYTMLVANALVLNSITMEKKLRVTEQMVSAVAPQTWMDGKIIGLAGGVTVVLLQFALSLFLFQRGRALASAADVQMGAAEPATMLLMMVFALLGAVFWLVTFGALAATIDDIRSPRAQVLFLPPLFAVAALVIVPIPDSTLARLMSWFPLTSPAAMPVRVALTEVPAWELVLSVVLLAASAWFMRNAAGRVFALGMLMYGKEPGWREIRRWAREA